MKDTTRETEQAALAERDNNRAIASELYVQNKALVNELAELKREHERLREAAERACPTHEQLWRDELHAR